MKTERGVTVKKVIPVMVLTFLVLYFVISFFIPAGLSNGGEIIWHVIWSTVILSGIMTFCVIYITERIGEARDEILKRLNQSETEQTEPGPTEDGQERAE